jgi:hypothetical protein
VLTEVQGIIKLLVFKRNGKQSDPESIMLEDKIVEQLRSYSEEIVKMYQDNPYRNFEHASHVTVRFLLLWSRLSAETEFVPFLTICSDPILSWYMSVVRLFSRIVAPDLEDIGAKYSNDEARALHDATYGIASDPWTQLAVMLSALVHDVDHPGVPNTRQRRSSFGKRLQ